MGGLRACGVLAVCWCACAKGAPAAIKDEGAPGDSPREDTARPNDSPRPIDAEPIDVPVDADLQPSTLLLSEVMLAPVGAEFIELFNPTLVTVDLTDYYLSNSGQYWKTPLGSAFELDAGEFVVRFPANSTLTSGQVITVALGSAQAFEAFTTIAPTYSIANGTVTTISATGTPALADTGQLVALFEWDGTSPLVADIDLIEVGQPLAADQLVSKSGIAQGSGQYKPDANTLPLQAATPPSGSSTKRIQLEAGFEIENGSGNGLTGHDETSEQTTDSWDSSFTSPTPGTVPLGLLPP